MKLSIVIPTYNEGGTIEKLIQCVQSVQYPIPHEIIIVDDGSQDHTYEREVQIRTQSPENERTIRLFKNNSNRGKSYSIRKAIAESQGDLLIVQDADLEYSPQEIPKLLMPVLSGQADIVLGSRFMTAAHPKGMGNLSWMANHVLTWLTNFLYGLRLTDMETCYKVFKTDALKKLTLRAEGFSFDPEAIALLAKQKSRILEIPISYQGRTHEDGKKIRGRDFFFAVATLLKYKFFN